MIGFPGQYVVISHNENDMPTLFDGAWTVLPFGLAL
jgi:hypothetical protein